jgi:L-amino acid N-acyltransferase YncA
MVARKLVVEALASDPEGLRAFESVREAVRESAGPELLDPGAQPLLCRHAGAPAARCSVQVVEGLHGAPGVTGLVGHYEALEADAGVAVLKEACKWLKARKVARVLGPMNGSTWARYRLALPPGAQFDPPWFLSEPRNPDSYPAHFEAAGFAVAARYESHWDDRLGEERPGAAGLGAEVALRALDPERFDDELRALYELSLEAFADNLYYTPITFEAFRAMYQRIRPLLDPELVTLAHDGGGRLLGYLFAYPDPRPGSNPTRIVVKTVATHPEARGAGLGHALLDRTRQSAHARGFRAAIHALMHVDNFSMKMSASHGSRVFRRYALYEWRP